MKSFIFILLSSLLLSSCFDHKSNTDKTSGKSDNTEVESVSDSPISSQDEKSIFITFVVTKIDENGYAWCGDNICINKLTNNIKDSIMVYDTLVVQLY